MSKVKRYDDSNYVLIEDDEGDYVKHEDYAKLESALTTILHLANSYDGNFIKACDNITTTAREALK